MWSEGKRLGKLRYLHRNPVNRGLVVSAEDWAWSSFRHYITGEAGVVEIESRWTAQRRERLGIYPAVVGHPPILCTLDESLFTVCGQAKWGYNRIAFEVKKGIPD